MYEPEHKPGKSGGWAVTNPMVTQNAKTTPFQVHFPKAEYYTVQFGVEPPVGDGTNGSGPGLGIFAAYADITWKIEGNYVTRRVSINNGVSVSGTGQGVDVTLTDATPDVGQGKNVPYKINVQVSPGARPSQNQPAILSLAAASYADIPIAPAGGIGVFTIPQNVGVISAEVCATCFSGGTKEPVDLILVFEGNGQTFKSIPITDQYAGFIPVPPGSVNVSIENFSGVGTAFVSVTFGIDG
jgi:hypothetical protein